MQKTPGSGIGMQSWQVSHRPDMSVLLELHSITFVHPGMHLYWPPKHAAEAHADFQKMMRDFVDLCYLIQTTATVSAVTRKESACGIVSQPRTLLSFQTLLIGKRLGETFFDANDKKG